ncbi:hypothetical protein B6I21_06840 [candidate division KSB1 bacterium 4572_119]|nr:MAG: hypothetical protein B6I21_06840 [candidate division KSB1 bacterium 4572_119]
MTKNIKDHILVIDDDAAVCDMLQSFLQLSDYKVTTCGTAEEAKNLLQTEKFSTFLVDVFLPDMDGIQFIAEIQEQGVKTPVIIITGSSELEIARKAIRLDVYDYLIKPFKQKNLQQVVHNAVMKNRLTEEQKDLEGQRLLYQTELEKMIQKKISELRESESKYRSLLEQTPDNGERTIEMWADAVTFQGMPAIEGMAVDISEREQSKKRERQLELQLLNEHKLSAIGRLTAGISHNLNTPISIIQGNAELLKLSHPELKESDLILKQTARMSEIIQTIAKKGRDTQNSKIVEIDLNKLLQEELSFLNANLYFKHHVTKEFSYADYLPPVMGVYSDFSQSILHIIQNAIDAVYECEKRVISISTELSDQAILIRIKDSGPGIKEEDRKKIFSPFFTTKPTQVDSKENPDAPRGTGLGLSLAKSSLASYGIEIDFETELNKGTTFTVTIPRPDTN